MKNMAVTGCLYHFSQSFKGYAYLLMYEQFIITIELDRLETFNWVKRSFSRMVVSNFKLLITRTDMTGEKGIFFWTAHLLNIKQTKFSVYHEYRLL